MAIIVALAVELVILLVYHALFSKLLSDVSKTTSLNINQIVAWLKAGTFIVLVLASPLIFIGAFGIFSAMSIYDYLITYKWYLYFIYTSTLVQAVMIPVVASILNYEKRWTKPVIVYLAIISILSLLGGSKGGALLQLLAIFSLLQFDTLKGYIKLLRVPLIALAALFSAFVYVAGQVFALDPSDMISLMFSRIFLNNDARALAIDFADSQSAGSASLFSESFRSLSTLLGTPPVNPPIGQFLYREAFQSSGFTGANGSSTALMILYGVPLEKAAFSIGLCIAALVIYMLARSRGRYSMARIAVCIALLSLLSQDFLALQIEVNALVLIAILVFIGLATRRLLVSVSHQH